MKNNTPITQETFDLLNLKSVIEIYRDNHRFYELIETNEKIGFDLSKNAFHFVELDPNTLYICNNPNLVHYNKYIQLTDNKILLSILHQNKIAIIKK